MKKITLFFLFIYSLNSITAQVGTLTGTGMSVCNLYSFSVCPNQTITPLNYGSQGYACTGTAQPDVSFNIMGGGWRVMKFNWFFSSTVNGVLSGFNSSGVLQTIPFLATNTITPLSYAGTFIQFALNGAAVGVPLNQTTFSISLTPVVFGSNTYTYCANTATSIAISPTVPVQGGPWTYNWQPGSLTGGTVSVSPSVNTIYTITANSLAGCASTTTVAVNINCTSTSTACSGSLLFDASHPGVNLPLTNQYYSGTNGGYTWECWFKLNQPFTANMRPLISSIDAVPYEDNWLGFGWLYGSFPEPVTKLVFKVDAPGSWVAVVPSCSYMPLGGFIIGTWYHAAGVMDYTNQISYLYVNGVLVDTKPIITPPITRVMTSSLALRSPNVPWTLFGNMDEVRIWERALTATEISTNYNQCLSGNEQNLLLYYKCNQPTAATVMDASPNNNTGVFSNLPNWSIQEPVITGTNCATITNTLSVTNSNSVICSGSTVTLTANDTYTWSSGVISNSIVVTPAVTTSYTITGLMSTCSGTNISLAITTVSVLPSPTITLSPNTSICQGSGTSATLTANGATSYTWNSAANLSSATGSIVTANPNSTETYTVTGTLNSCTNTAVTTVSVIATPTLSINSSSATICPLGSSSLIATGATNYTWSPISTLSSSAGSLVIASPNNTTTYTVLGSNGTCTNIAQAQAVITVTNNPIITCSNATICSSASANLSANGGVTYTWSPATNLNATTGSNVISTPTASIIYTVSGSSALGCIGSSSVSVTVIPTPTLTISSNSLNLCIVGQSSTLTANGASSYTWSPTTTINSINTNTTIATPVITTIYSVIGSNGFSPNICTSIQTIQINVGASSIPTVSPNDKICFGQSTTIYAIGGNTYHWNPTTGVSKPNDSTTLVKPSVTTIYTVTVSKNNICPVTATIQVIVDPLPIVNAGKDSTINIDQDIVLTGTGNVDVGFLSPDGNPLICNWCPIVTVHPLESTCYTLEGFNTYGCRNTDVVCITITKEWDIFIPNAFTPNGDISNDYFIPKGYGIAQIDLSIFDRWGVCIFKETNTTLGWDGKYKGQLCQQGIYVYQVNIKAMSGENTTKTGHVTLLSKLK